MSAPQDPFGPSGSSPHRPPPYGASSYGPPPQASGAGQPSGYRPQDTRTETKAIIALVLAVAAWTPTVPFVGAIAALFVARSARRDIEASGGRLTGLSLCRWATVLSWVHLAVVVGLALLALALVLLPFTLAL